MIDGLRKDQAYDKTDVKERIQSNGSTSGES